MFPTEQTKQLIINRSSGCGEQVRAQTPATSYTAVPQDTSGPRAGWKVRAGEEWGTGSPHGRLVYTHTHTASSDLLTIAVTPPPPLRNQVLQDPSLEPDFSGYQNNDWGFNTWHHTLLHALSPFLGGQQQQDNNNKLVLLTITVHPAPGSATHTVIWLNRHSHHSGSHYYHHLYRQARKLV